MIKTLQSLIENNVISEDVKESIERAWEQRVDENRQVVSQQLREEFAQKYEHDKNVMIEAVDRMINEQLSGELAEFMEDRKQLAEMKVKYAKKMKSDGKVVKEFITRQLSNEIRELHEDQKITAQKFGKLENFVIEALAQEITEFFEDKKDIANTKVRLVREGKQHLNKVKQTFIKRAASLVENTVSNSLRNELGSLREDIEAARRADFGRKLFEAFASEYQTSYLNEKSETAKLMKVISMKDAAIQEAASAVTKAEKILEKKQSEISMLKEANQRDKIINELLNPLGTEQREIMGELMERVKTSRLQESFEKYLPAVLAGSPPRRKQSLVEAKEITGNKIPNTKRSSELESNIVDIRRLAGLKV
jgi:hypothetical protein